MRGPSDDPGIVPRVIEMLFHERQETDEVDLLALQVCCDGIYDLLKGKENVSSIMGLSNEAHVRSPARTFKSLWRWTPLARSLTRLKWADRARAASKFLLTDGGFV